VLFGISALLHGNSRERHRRAAGSKVSSFLGRTRAGISSIPALGSQQPRHLAWLTEALRVSERLGSAALAALALQKPRTHLLHREF